MGCGGELSTNLSLIYVSLLDLGVPIVIIGIIIIYINAAVNDLCISKGP